MVHCSACNALHLNACGCHRTASGRVVKLQISHWYVHYRLLLDKNNQFCLVVSEMFKREAFLIKRAPILQCSLAGYSAVFLRFKAEADYSCYEFWELTRQLGNLVQLYTDTLLHDTAIAYAAAAQKLYDFRNTMDKVVSSTTELGDDVQETAILHGFTLEKVSEMLSADLAIVMDELKAEFPAPSDADHHGQRVEMISRALAKLEESVVRVSTQCGVSEPRARAEHRNSCTACSCCHW